MAVVPPCLNAFFVEDIKRPWSYSFLGHQTSNPGIMQSRLVGDFRENICNLPLTGIECQNIHLNLMKRRKVSPMAKTLQ